jgi:AraC family transcriptional regulator of adaptative response / DNA-3-methyladenine glycosylase II
VENVSDGVYSRTVRLVNGGKTYQGWLRIANLPKKNSLAITVATTLLPVLPQVLARVRSMFDLNCNPGEVYEKLAALERSKPGMCLPGRRLPGCFSPFEMAVCAVLGQQVSVKTMRTLAMRLVQHYGEKIETPFADLAYNFPLPESIAALTGKKENLRQIGLTQVKTNSLYLLANALLKGEIDLSTTADPEKEILGLKKLPGFGAWTAEYIAMRTLGWPDAFLPTDLSVRKAFSNLTLKEVLLLAEEWRPWRSYAIVNIWCSLA